MNVSGWDTSKVTSIWGMFEGCTALSVLDLSDWNTASTTDMGRLFAVCSNLSSIYVGDGWTTSNVDTSGNMFYDCNNLVGGSGTPFDSSYVDKTYARVDNLPDEPGYLTYKAQP